MVQKASTVDPHCPLQLHSMLLYALLCLVTHMVHLLSIYGASLLRY